MASRSLWRTLYSPGCCPLLLHPRTLVNNERRLAALAALIVPLNENHIFLSQPNRNASNFCTRTYIMFVQLFALTILATHCLSLAAACWLVARKLLLCLFSYRTHVAGGKSAVNLFLGYANLNCLAFFR